MILKYAEPVIAILQRLVSADGSGIITNSRTLYSEGVANFDKY